MLVELSALFWSASINLVTGLMLLWLLALDLALLVPDLCWVCLERDLLDLAEFL